MIGIWQSNADIFLIVAGIAMLVGFGLPILLAPMAWARLFRWEVPGSSSLAVFMERSLGIFICIMSVFAFKAAQNPAYRPFLFVLMLWIFGGMILLHVYGAIRKSQPVTETIEIALWVLLSLVTLGFYPV